MIDIEGIDRLSPKKEDYIKILFDLGGQREKVKNKKIANLLNISPPTVTEMMIRLEKFGWVKYIPYKGSVLTAEGAKYAKELIHKHRLWEVFLVDKLGFNRASVHDEAEKLEHTTSLDLAVRLNKYLGYPEYCPHGGAIPLELIKKQERQIYQLSDVHQGLSVVISRIVNEKKIVKYFENTHLNIGDEIKIIRYDSKLDLLHLRKPADDMDVEVSGTIAQYLFVKFKNEDN